MVHPDLSSRCIDSIQGKVSRSITLGSGQGGDVSGLGADIVDDGGLEPGDHKVSSFVVDLLLNTEHARVLDCTVTSIN